MVLRLYLFKSLDSASLLSDFCEMSLAECFWIRCAKKMNEVIGKFKNLAYLDPK